MKNTRFKRKEFFLAIFLMIVGGGLLFTTSGVGKILGVITIAFSLEIFFKSIDKQN